MKAEIKTYKINAKLTVGDELYLIYWDNIEFDTNEEYKDWIREKMKPAEKCDNYNDVKLTLEISTDYLRP